MKSYHLIGFCDASLRAYAVVVYLLIETDSEQHLRFLAAKTRVSPSNRQTRPGLELLSAFLLARLMTTVRHALTDCIPLDQSLCYTDSKVALFWIQGLGKDWKPFVQNRVQEIRKLLPVDCWRHCSGKVNPADIPSRGMRPLELSVNLMWRDGPDWPIESEEKATELQMPEDCLTEVKKDKEVVHNLLAVGEPCGIGQVMDCKKYSSLHHLLMVTVYLLRIVRLLKLRIQSNIEESGHQDMEKILNTGPDPTESYLVKKEKLASMSRETSSSSFTIEADHAYSTFTTETDHTNSTYDNVYEGPSAMETQQGDSRLPVQSDLVFQQGQGLVLTGPYRSGLMVPSQQGMVPNQEAGTLYHQSQEEAGG